MRLSQEALAERADVHRTYVSAVERGRVRLGLEVAHRLAVGLGVSLSALIRDAERTMARGGGNR
jgi:transcriptional regulator with XRE-family HTH domain